MVVAHAAGLLVRAPRWATLIDRWNRKVVMVTADIGRAGLLLLLPFWENIWGLVVLSFAIEMLTLLWAPAKEATLPNIVKDPDQLASANSLGLVAVFGTFPLGAVMFAALAGIAHWLGGFDALNSLSVKQESLAIWVDGGTFLLSALFISRLRLDEGERGTWARVPVAQTWIDIKEGLGFIRSNPLVRGVMIGLAGGLIGGGAIVPLGCRGRSRRLARRPRIFRSAHDRARGRRGDRGGHVAVAPAPAPTAARVHHRGRVDRGGDHRGRVDVVVVAGLRLVAALGAAAGCAYVTGFTLLQESVADDMRGRTFATLYTIVRLCLLLSLTIWPFIAGALTRSLAAW